MKVGGIRPLDEIEHLVLPGVAGELFKSLLGDERHLDVSPCGKLNKSVAQAGLKTMQGEGLALLATHHWLLICGVQAEGQHPRASVPVKHKVLIGLVDKTGSCFDPPRRTTPWRVPWLNWTASISKPTLSRVALRP